MAHYYGRMQGHRAQVTRTGTKSSGIAADISTWDFHVKTKIEQNSNGDEVVTFKLVTESGKILDKIIINATEILKDDND